MGELWYFIFNICDGFWVVDTTGSSAQLRVQKENFDIADGIAPYILKSESQLPSKKYDKKLFKFTKFKNFKIGAPLQIPKKSKW